MVYIFPDSEKYASQLGRKIFPVGFQKKSSWVAKTAVSERDKAQAVAEEKVSIEASEISVSGEKGPWREKERL